MRIVDDRCAWRSRLCLIGGCEVMYTCMLQADDLLVMREQNYQLGRDNSRLRRRLAELQKVCFQYWGQLA